VRGSGAKQAAVVGEADAPVDGLPSMVTNTIGALATIIVAP
jgi:hypothetical protein